MIFLAGAQAQGRCMSGRLETGVAMSANLWQFDLAGLSCVNSTQPGVWKTPLFYKKRG